MVRRRTTDFTDRTEAYQEGRTDRLRVGRRYRTTSTTPRPARLIRWVGPAQGFCRSPFTSTHYHIGVI
jgi:hypothetical protein